MPPLIRLIDSSMTIKTCFFDMGNVLVHFSHEKMCQNIAVLCGWSEPATKKFLLDEGRQWKLERGDVSEEQFHDELCQAAGKALVNLGLLASEIGNCITSRSPAGFP